MLLSSVFYKNCNKAAGIAGTSATANEGNEKEKESGGSSKTKYIAIGATALVAGVGAVIKVKKNRKK